MKKSQTLISVILTGFLLLTVCGALADIEDPPPLDVVPWSGWWWPYDNQFDAGSTLHQDWGPLDKYDKIVGLHGLSTTRKSELYGEVHGRLHGPGNHAKYSGNGDAWAVAALRYDEPTVMTNFGGVQLLPSDKKGLLCAVSAMYTPQVIDTKDSPANFLRCLRQYIRDKQVGMIADIHTEVPEMWGVHNLPIYDYKAEIESFNDPHYPMRHNVRLTVEYVSDQVEPTFTGTKTLTKEYTFEVNIDESGILLGNGTWTGLSTGYSDARPERVWVFSEPSPWNSCIDENLVEFLVFGGDVAIVSPDLDDIIIAGSTEAPDTISLCIQITRKGEPITGIHRGKTFEITIGDKAATVLNVFNRSDTICLEVLPPVIDSLETLDLTVKVGNHTVIREDCVRYLINGNPDIPLIIDRSGSMDGSNYMEPAKDAASLFVDFMEESDSVGVISFATNANLEYPLTAIDSQDIKDDAKQAIAGILPYGWTSIGAGLEIARDQLDLSAFPDHNWSMVLLSDGIENTAPYVNQILPTIPDRVRIFTIALGPASDQELLNRIATETGGEYFMAPEADDLKSIYALVAGEITGEDILDITRDTILTGEVKTNQAVIDSSVSKIEFSLSWDDGDLAFTLIDPHGETIDPDVALTNLNIFYEESDGFKQYTIRQPDSGQWTTVVEGTTVNPDGEDYTTIIRGRTALRMNGYLDRPEYRRDEPILIGMTIFNNDQYIRGMDVRAQVNLVEQSRGSGQFTTISGELVEIPLNPRIGSRNRGGFKLYDDGKHGDGAPNDGVYANYWTETEDPGSYTFTVNANGLRPDGSWFQRMETCATVVTDNPNDLFVSEPGELQLTGFANNSITQTVTVSTLNSDPDCILTAKCTDLVAANKDSIPVSDITINPVEIHLSQDKSADVTFTVNVSESVNPNVYHGDLMLFNTESTLRIPVSLTISAGQPPRVTINTDTSWGPLPLTVQFSCDAVSPGSTITDYSWDFNAFDGIQIDASGQNVQHTFDSCPCPVEMVEPYTMVTVTITDARGLEATDTIRINLLPQVTVKLEMPLTYYSPGDPLWLKAHVRNYKEEMHVLGFLVLDLGTGYYWCYPDWLIYPPDLNVDYGVFPIGTDSAYAFEDLVWPDTGAAVCENLNFWGLLIRTDNNEILGNSLPLWSFAYGPK